MNIHINSQDPSTASLIQVDFYFHEKVQVRTIGDFERDDNTHPVIYVGGECANLIWPLPCESGETTGGSYPSSEIWQNVGPLSYDENVSGAGPYIHYSEFLDGNPDDQRGIVILPEINIIDFGSSLNMRWFGTSIPWGLWEANNLGEWTQALPWVGDVGNDGPPGPAFNSGWNTPEDNNGFNIYTSRP